MPSGQSPCLWTQSPVSCSVECSGLIFYLCYKNRKNYFTCCYYYHIPAFTQSSCVVGDASLELLRVLKQKNPSSIDVSTARNALKIEIESLMQQAKVRDGWRQITLLSVSSHATGIWQVCLKYSLHCSSRKEKVSVCKAVVSSGYN